MKHLLLSIWALVLLAACAPSPRAVAYGSDMCHFCKMTVVDAQHAAQLVTMKGKITMYDAIECMVQQIGNEPGIAYAHALVNDYAAPGVLVPAAQSTFLISKAIPSPMGAFLSAFSDKTVAVAMRDGKGGELYDWTGLQQHILGESHDIVADQLNTK